MINTSQYLHFTISCQVEKSHIDIFFTKARSTCYGPNDIGSNITQFKSYPNNITILMISLSDLFISQLSLYFDRVHSSSLSSSSSTPTASLRSVLMFSSKSLKSILVSSPPASRETTSLPTSESVSNRLFPPAPEPLLIFIFLISSLDSLKQPPLPTSESVSNRLFPP